MPWFLHLLHKLQVGSPAVLDLLAPAPLEQHKPKFVRAKLYEYDFTRLPTTWAQNNPALVGDGEDQTQRGRLLPPGANPLQGAAWWHRRGAAEFIGVLEANHKGLAEFLGQRGWDPAFRPPEQVADGSFGCTVAANGTRSATACMIFEGTRAAGTTVLVLTTMSIVAMASLF